MDKQTLIRRENLAMRIMLLRDKQMKKETTFEEALSDAVTLITNYEECAC